MKFLKPRDKTFRPPEISREPESTTIAQIPLLAEMAIEVWRVAGRTGKLQDSAKKDDPAIGFSIEKIYHILTKMGVEIKDPTGEIYHEGMCLDVLTFDYSPDEPPANRIIQETLSPAIYYNGRLIKMAKVIIGSAGG